MHGDSQGEGIGVFGDYQFTGSLLSIISSPPIREEPNKRVCQSDKPFKDNALTFIA